MRVKVVFLLLFITGMLSAQSWEKLYVADNWGDSIGYTYVQKTTCSGQGSSGNDIWNFAIIYSPAEHQLGFVIYTNKELQWAPAFVMINEDVTISLRREGSRAAQTFQGLLSSARSDTDNLVIYCSDQRLVNILQENGRNTILVEPKRGDWYVRATVNGNMPKE